MRVVRGAIESPKVQDAMTQKIVPSEWFIRTHVTSSIRLILCAALAVPWGTPAAAWNDYSNPNYRVNDYQSNLNNRLNLPTRPAVSLPTFEIRTPIAPALNINAWTMRLPEINVPDIGNSVWTFQRVTNNFNPQLKSFDHYQANISFKFGDNIAPRSVMMDIGKMKFQQGTQTPERFTRVYKDDVGNTFTKVRTEQMSRMNEGFNTFVQHFQREGKLAYANQLLNPMTRPANIPPEPSLEVTDGFREKWTLSTLDDQGRRQRATYNISVDLMKSKELGRFVSEYSGRLSDGKQTVQFTVTAPHDFNGKITALNVKIEGKGFPTAHVEWKPVDGQSAEEAFLLLRQNLPAPLFVGPNSSLRLNGVDIVEAPLHVTPNGDIAAKQIGSAKDLVNLMGKEDLGIKVSFSPTKEAGGGFSLMNSLKNLGYMLTGRWSEVKSLRQQFTTMQNQEPGKFVLAAGFSDPSFMSLSDLKTSMAAANRIPRGLADLLKGPRIEEAQKAGLFVNDTGREFYRTEEGRVIPVTDLKEDMGDFRKNTLPSISELTKSFDKTASDFRTYRAQFETTFGGDKTKMPADSLPSKLIEPVSSSLESNLSQFTQWSHEEETHLNVQTSEAEKLIDEGQYEKAYDMFSAIDGAAGAFANMVALADESVASLQSGLDDISHAARYSTIGREKSPVQNLTDKDAFLVNESEYFTSDKDFNTARAQIVLGTEKTREASNYWAALGLMDSEGWDTMREGLNQEFNDTFRGLANIKERAGISVEALDFANRLGENAGEVVIGAQYGNLTPKEYQGVWSKIGQAASWFSGWGLARDVGSALVLGRGEYVKGFINKLTNWESTDGGEKGFWAEQGAAHAEVAFSVYSSFKGLRFSVPKMVSSGFKEGKADTAIYLAAALPMTARFKSALKEAKVLKAEQMLLTKSDEVKQLKRIYKVAAREGKSGIVKRLESQIQKEEVNLSKLRLGLKDQRYADKLLAKQTAKKQEIKGLKDELKLAKEAKDSKTVKQLEKRIEKEKGKLNDLRAEFRGLTPSSLSFADLYKMQGGKKILERVPGTEGLYRMKLEPVDQIRPEKFSIKGKAWVGKSWAEGKIRGYKDHGVFARYDKANQLAANETDTVILRLETKAVGALEADLRKTYHKPSSIEEKYNSWVRGVEVNKSNTMPADMIARKYNGSEIYVSRKFNVKVGPDEDLLAVGKKSLDPDLIKSEEFGFVFPGEESVISVRNKHFNDLGIGSGQVSTHGGRANTILPLESGFRIRASIPGDDFVYLIDSKKGLSEFLNIAANMGYEFKIPRHWQINEQFLSDQARRNIYFADINELGKVKKFR